MYMYISGTYWKLCYGYTYG